MRIGLISDTHDNVPMVKKAVQIFNSESVDLVLHAGDYVAPFAVKPLLQMGCEFIGVFGNNDGDRIAIQNASRGKISTQFSIKACGNKTILLGHYFETLDALAASQKYSLIVYGHTHRPEIRREGTCLIINPGECGGWLYGKSTIALVDLASEQAAIITLS